MNKYTYNIWRIAGGNSSWLQSYATGFDPVSAFRAAVEAEDRRLADSSPSRDRAGRLYDNGETYIVAASGGGHGQAAVIQLRRNEADAAPAFIQTVSI